MRIEAPQPDPWTVYHCEECCVLRCVLWVDDATAQWAAEPLRVDGGEVIPTIYQARHIVINPDAALVLINPVADGEELHEADVLECAA